MKQVYRLPAIIFSLGACLWLAGCNTNPAAEKLTCDDSQKICYRGNSIDNEATVEKFGVEGSEAIEKLNKME